MSEYKKYFENLLGVSLEKMETSPVLQNVNEDVEIVNVQEKLASPTTIVEQIRTESKIQKEIKKETTKTNKRYIGEVSELPSTVEFEEGTLVRKGQTVYIKQDGLWESLIEGNTVTREVVKYGVPGGGCGVDEVKNLIKSSVASFDSPSQIPSGVDLGPTISVAGVPWVRGGDGNYYPWDGNHVFASTTLRDEFFEANPSALFIGQSVFVSFARGKTQYWWNGIRWCESEFTQCAFDAFDGPAGALNGRALGSSNWTGPSGSAGASFVIDGAGSLTLSGGGSGEMAVIDPGSKRYCVDLIIRPQLNSPLAIVTNYTDGNNYTWIDFSNGITLYSKVAGVNKPEYFFPKTVAGLVLPVTIFVDGDQMDVSIDGLTSFTYIERNVPIARNFGFRRGGLSGVAAKVDAISITNEQQKLNLRWPRFKKDLNKLPIVALGSSGQWDDVDVNNPTIYRNTVLGRWELNYSGYGAVVDQVQHSGNAYSNSLLGPWTKYASNPIRTSAGKWAFNGGIANWNNETWSVQGNGSGGLMLAVSTDGGYTWTDYGTVVTTASDAFLFVDNANVLKVLYRKNDGNGHSFYIGTVNANHTVTEPAIALVKPPIDLFGVGFVGEPSLFMTPGKAEEIMLFFDGSRNNSDSRVICSAITIDGGATWHWRVCALTTTGGGAWEANQTFDSCPFWDEDTKTLHLFYAAAPGPGGTLGIGIQIGHSSAPYIGDRLEQ